MIFCLMSDTESKEKEERRPALNSSKQSNPLWLEKEMTTQDPGGTAREE